jgi:hypothetical protein
VPEIEAMMTGEALMSSELTCGVTFCGSFSAATFWAIAAFVSLTFVPYENWATTRAIELAEVDWTRSRRGIPEIARSIGLATWSATSEAPAPGSAATTVMIGSSMSGSSSCFRLPHAEMPAMNNATASRSATLRLLTASSVSRLTNGLP